MRLNILFVIPYFVPAYRFGGPVRGSYEVAKRLIKKGHNVTVYTTDVLEPGKRVGKKVDFIDDINVRYFSNLSNELAARAKIFTPRGYTKELSENIQKFDIIHIQEYYSILTYLTYKILSVKKYLVSIRGVLSPVPMQSKSRLKKIFDFFCKNALHRADAVTVQTDMEKADCEKHGLNNLRIIRNGIDTNMFKKIPSGASFRKKHHIKPSEKVLLFIGRINEIKGLKYLVEAMSKIDDKKLRLFVVGPDDNYLNTLNQHIKERKVKNIKIIEGLYDEDKLKALAAADVFILPSIYDCSPNSMLEACAAGLPIITTEQNGLRDIVERGAGIVVPARDPEALKEAILKMNKSTINKMGRQGRKIVHSEFSWDTITDDLESLYKEILNVRH